MIIFLLFLSLFIGINVRQSIVFGIIEILILLVFVFFRFGKKPFIAVTISCLLGVGLSFIRPSFNKKEYLSVVEEVKTNYYIVNSTFEKMYIYQREHNYEVGDILLIKGVKQEIADTSIESSFNFKNYLNNKGVYSQMYPSSIKVKFYTPFRLRKVKKEFLKKLDANSRALIGSFLFSMGSEEEIYEEMQSLHLNRLLSNSGFYLSSLFAVLGFFLSYLIKKDKIKDLVLIGLFIPMVLFSFPRFVVIKFVFVKFLRWINDHLLKKKFSYLEVISFSGIFFLLINYYYAYQTGFLLTYLIPISALFFMNSFKGMKSFAKRLLISGLILLEFIPFALLFYNEICPLSIIFQIVLAPFFVLYYFASIISFIGVPIYGFINNYGQFLLSFINVISKVNFAIYGMDMTAETIFIFEAIYFICIYYLSSRFKPMVHISLSLFIVANSIIFIPFKNVFIDQVSFINVGQGDATLIQRNSTAILIDTGGLNNLDVAKDSLIPFFKKNRIYNIDLLITTHEDFDHSGGVDSLIKNFTVHRYIKDYKSFPVNVGGITLNNYNIYPDLWNEENDRSLVIGFKTRRFNYLIMGDAPKKIEEKIIQDNNSLPCDILKVGHHGSNTSTSEKFIKYLSPKVSVISCGKKNKYGHPHKEVLAILNKYRIVIRRTDLEGTITYWQ